MIPCYMNMWQPFLSCDLDDKCQIYPVSSKECSIGNLTSLVSEGSEKMRLVETDFIYLIQIDMQDINTYNKNL